MEDVPQLLDRGIKMKISSQVCCLADRPSEMLLAERKLCLKALGRGALEMQEYSTVRMGLKWQNMCFIKNTIFRGPKK